VLSSRNIIRVVKSRRMRSVGHVAHVGGGGGGGVQDFGVEA